MRSRRWIRPALLSALAAAIVVFAGRAVADEAGTFEGEALATHWHAFALATLAIMTGTLMLAASWAVLLEGASRRRGRRLRLIIAFAYAWLGRYVPGALPFVAAKLHLARTCGYGTRAAAVATGVQGLIEIVVAGAIGCALILASRAMGSVGFVAGAVAVVACIALLLLYPPVLLRIGNHALRAARREPLALDDIPGHRMFAVAALLTAGTQLVNGLALFAVLQSISAVSPSDVLFCIGVTSLAGVAGMIVVIAPAGLGVRDGVLVTLLSARIPLEFAALAAVFLRALSLVADLALAGAALIIDVVASQHVASGAFSLRTPADPAAVEHAGATPEERAA